jgi:VanZ family protein
MRLSDRQHKLLRILWSVLALLVVVGSLLPAYSLPIQALDKLHIPDKVIHFLAYAVLAFLPALHETRRMTALFLASVMLLGVLIEFGQRYSVGRFSEVADVLANGWGVICGLLLGARLRS